MDHSETLAPELQPRDGETADERAARITGVVCSRVPDLRLVLDRLDAPSVGLVGHSLGGWSVLAAAEDDARVAAVVALAPGGSRHPTRGVLSLPLELTRGVPTLVLAADAGAYSCDGPPVNFVELVLGKTAVNWSPGEAAMRSVLLLDAAYRSAASGRVERV